MRILVLCPGYICYFNKLCIVDDEFWFYAMDAHINNTHINNAHINNAHFGVMPWIYKLFS